MMGLHINTHTHTHIHIYIHIYIFIYILIQIVRLSEIERDGWAENFFYNCYTDEIPKGLCKNIYVMNLGRYICV